MVSVKLFFGISYLSLPNTFAQCGLLGGVLLFTMVLMINGFTMLQILKVSEHYSAKSALVTGIRDEVKSYSDLGSRVLGRRGK